MSKFKVLDKEQLLETLNQISDSLPSGDDVLYEILSALGIAMGVDRTYLFDFRCLVDGNLVASQRAEWVEVGQSRQISNPTLQNIDMAESGFSDWNEQLLKGKCIIGLVKDFPDDQRAFLADMQGIQSIVFMPVFADDQLVGAMGYDDCSSERIWKEDEVDVLCRVALLIGKICYSSELEASTGLQP